MTLCFSAVRPVRTAGVFFFFLVLLTEPLMRGAPVLCCDCPQCGSTIGAPSWKRQRLSVDHVLLSIRSVGSEGERKRELHGSFARSHDIRRRGDDEFRLYETCGASLEKSSTVCFRDNGTRAVVTLYRDGMTVGRGPAVVAMTDCRKQLL